MTPLFILCALLLTGLNCNGYSTTLNELNSSIKSQQKKLDSLKKQLGVLEEKKEKLLQEERSIAKNLKEIDSRLEGSAKKQVKIGRQIREIEPKITQLQLEVLRYSSEGSLLESSLLANLRGYHVLCAFPRRLESRPLREMGMKVLIGLKFRDLKSAEESRDFARRKESQLYQFKKNLNILKLALGKEIDVQKIAKAEKSQLYKTTQGKRLIAEQEADKLRETSEALSDLLAGLIKKKEKTLAAQREAEQLKRAFQEKKGQFPWPVLGTVVSRFGRQRNSDLDITVINNGIRIRTEPGAQVNAVAGGTVVYASDFRSYGQTVIVDHGAGDYSIYGLLGNILVSEGKKVEGGDVLGSASSDAQLYFEFRNQGKAVDPLNWLK